MKPLTQTSGSDILYREGTRVRTLMLAQVNWLPLLITASATWRLTHLLMYEAGPWDAVVKLRALFGVSHYADGAPYVYPKGSVFECFLCLSIWISAAVSVLPRWVSHPLAVSGLVIMAEKWYKRG